MDGATSCFWVFMCESAYVKSQRFGPFMVNTQMRFFSKQTLLTCQKTNQTRAKNNIVKNFVVRNDEQVVRRINANPRRNNATSLYAWRIGEPSKSVLCRKSWSSSLYCNSWCHLPSVPNRVTFSASSLLFSHELFHTGGRDGRGGWSGGFPIPARKIGFNQQTEQTTANTRTERPTNRPTTTQPQPNQFFWNVVPS